MMSNRKQRGRSSDAAHGSKQQPSRDSEGQPARTPDAIHPPKRNVMMLSISLVLFAIWISFLVYVALFG